ncbi:aminopeptidase P family protein [Verrucomicrobiota bacterium sgz303538]
MRHKPIPAELFVSNRNRLRRELAPNSLVVVHANDVPVTNADGTSSYYPNSDLFYLTGVEQEESILLLAPDAHDEKQREILFLRETNEHIAQWEGHKLTKEEAREVTGIQQVKWLSEFPTIFRMLMSEVEGVYLNSNEHRRALDEVETRDLRFIRETQRRFPLHQYRRLAPLMHRLRVVKSEPELALIREAAEITRAGYERVMKFVKPGVNECEIEAEFIHEFMRRRGRFAYSPIIASGKNACVLHYITNDQGCAKGDLLLLDVAAGYANYNADVTRTIPVDGRFNKRQKQVYNSVLRVLRRATEALKPGKLPKDWQKEAEAFIQEELLELELLKPRDIKKQDPDRPALKRYFMHGVGHPLGLDVHDVATTGAPFAAGWVMTVEPGIYIPEEGFAVRLEDDILITEEGTVNLTKDIPIEADEIEEFMRR